MRSKSTVGNRIAKRREIQVVLDAETGKVMRVTDAENRPLERVRTGKPTAKFIDADSITVVRTNPCIWVRCNGVWYRFCWN